MAELMSLEEAVDMQRCLQSVRDDLGYQQRVLAESVASINQMWAYLELRLQAMDYGIETPKAPSTPTTPNAPWNKPEGAPEKRA
ncbi:hypothetical protein Purlil1_13581 [Purpureocillium lilacinum]|uniref:Uncharacterized protein n=1 Tax=Purpureocillium lilacinum TaxID=33203 RepID=A0ABR0BDM9_PURLI|nr:hypothetical protein Purlil1_13581 [Purpureocillium lilacinum]